MKKKVCVQGLGFVGSAMSVAVAMAKDETGNACYDVVGIDLPNEEGLRRVRAVNEGVFPFESNDIKLKRSMEEAFRTGNFKASTSSEEYKEADYVIVDINLDISYNEGEPYLELNPFRKAMHTLGQCIKEDCLIIVETTVPPGTCEKVVYPIILSEFEKRGIDRRSIHIAHSYERVMPGEQYFDSIVNFWRVYSGINKQSADMCEEFLKTVIRTDEYPLTRLQGTTSTETAKVLENSYRATTIAFMEEWGRFAESVEIDLYSVIDAIRMRPTHSNMRQPGFGVGGYCLTKDPYFAMLASKDLFGFSNMEFPFSTQAVKTNNKMPLVSLEKIEELLGGLDGKRILLMGISYRQDVGDTRYSPSENFSRKAIEKGAIVAYQDPLVSHWREMECDVRKEIPSFDEYDAIVFAVQHKQYSTISFNNVYEKEILVFDANRVLNKDQIRAVKDNPKLWFYGIGRGGEK